MSNGDARQVPLPLSGATPSLAGMHHPWRAFRALVDWTLHWRPLPDGLLGYTDFTARSVVLDTRLTQVERRCTIAHETEHILRGPAHPRHRARDERAVDDAAARKLIPLEALAEALVWSYDDHELAEELWVDLATVRARLKGLTDEETALLNERVDRREEGFVSDPDDTVHSC